MMKKLKFWAIMNEPHSRVKAIDREIRCFEKETGIKVELTEFPWRKIWDSIINSVKEGNRPDVVQIGNSWISIFSDIGYLENISDPFFNDNRINHFYNISHPIHNQYYAFPWILDLNLLFIRKTRDEDHIRFDTIEDLLDLAKKNRRKELFSIGGNKNIILLQYVSAFLWSFGGEFIEKNSINLLSRNNFQGIRTFFDLVHSSGIKNFLLNPYWDVIEDFFLRGNGLFTFAKAWAINSYIKPYHIEDKFTGMVMPGTRKHQYPFKGGSCLGVIKNSRLKKESMELIRFLTSSDSQKRYMSSTGLLPVHRDVMNKLIDNYIYKDAIRVTLERAKTYPAAPYWGSFEKIFVEFINNVFIDIMNRQYNRNRLEQKLGEVNKKIRNVIRLWERYNE
ncbi:MAG: extracellular solute-binding protein [bacterium]|nr:extracellular solute-binding protein [bacterium]